MLQVAIMKILIMAMQVIRSTILTLSKLSTTHLAERTTSTQDIWYSPFGLRNFYPEQIDNETDNGMDGYAGEFGKAIDKFQLVVE